MMTLPNFSTTPLLLSVLAALGSVNLAQAQSLSPSAEASLVFRLGSFVENL